MFPALGRIGLGLAPSLPAGARHAGAVRTRERVIAGEDHPPADREHSGSIERGRQGLCHHLDQLS